MPATNPPTTVPCVFLVCESNETAALRSHFLEPLPQGPIEVVVETGGADALARFFARRPDVVVITATLSTGDSRAMLDALRAATPRGQLGVVLIGDAVGPVRTALDALDFAADRFVARPLSAKSLRFAVGQCLEMVATSRNIATASASRPAIVPIATSERPSERSDQIGKPASDAYDAGGEPRSVTAPGEWQPGNTAALGPSPHDWDAPMAAIVEREPTFVLGSAESAEPLEIPELPAQTRAIDFDGDTGAGSLALAERSGEPGDSWHITPVRPVTEVVPAAPDAANSTDVPPPSRGGGRDFARELREKMTRMADRLFAQPGGSGPVDVSPRHSHETEIDIGAFADEPSLPGNATEIIGLRSPDAAPSDEVSSGSTTPGAWLEPARDRAAIAASDVALGTADAVNLIARCHRQGLTGRLVFRNDRHELVLFFDAGRLVFASSNQPADRMGAMLCREGKITRAQFSQCDQQVGKSGRRTGETLVDLGFLKRRELLPAVRRHLEDILFSAFSWRTGTYVVVNDEVASVERIRMSRLVPALVVEGIRRKYDVDTLARIGVTPSAVLELADREKAAGVLAAMDVPPAERAAISEADGVADLGILARKAGGDFVGLASVAYGLAVFGIATLRRGASTDEEPELDDTNALVGETDIAIDRARVLGRCQLVEEADYFAMLGVRREASAFEIRRAFDAARRDFALETFPAELRRELAREISAISQVLEEAFWVLRDDQLRASYLRHLVDRVDAMDRVQ